MTTSDVRPPLFGVVGWKNAGKTTLVERLVAEFTKRGLSIATIKHAHHGFDVDQAGTDSFRHRAAGAHQVALVSSKRVAVMRELRNEAEPALDEIVKRLDPCDLILVEGFKRETHPKIEVRSKDQRRADGPMLGRFPEIVAIASDEVESEATVPVFHRDNIAAIATFAVTYLGLSEAST